MSGTLVTLGLKLWDTITEHCGDYIPNLARIRAANRAREAGLIEAAKQSVIVNAHKFGTGEWEFDLHAGELVKHHDMANRDLRFDASLSPHDRLMRAHARELDRKASNLLSVIKYASDEALREEEAVTEALSTSAVQADWFARWKQEAENVSTEEMQRIWATILLGEVKRPGTFSPRTLDVIRNLTSSDAQTIQQVMSFVIAGSIILRDLPMLHECGVPFASLAVVEELGLIAPVDLSGLGGREYKWGTRRIQGFSADLHLRGALIVQVIGGDHTAIVKLPAIVLTRVGRDVLNLTQRSDPPDLYIDRIASQVKSQAFAARLLRRTVRSDGVIADDLVREL